MNAPSFKYRTLVADDEQPARDRLKKLLSEYSHKVELIGEATNGLECSEMHFSSRYVVRMDDCNQTRLISGRGYCDQIKQLMEI